MPAPRAIRRLCRPLGTRFVALFFLGSFEDSSGSSTLGSDNGLAGMGRSEFLKNKDTTQQMVMVVEE
jgi:hypothetical protein